MWSSALGIPKCVYCERAGSHGKYKESPLRFCWEHKSDTDHLLIGDVPPKLDVPPTQEPPKWLEDEDSSQP